MNEKKTKPLSVGEQLHKEIDSLNKTEFAIRIGISRRQLYNLLNDKRKLTLAVAQCLGRETGKGAKYWLDLEHEHRLYCKGLR